MSWYFDPNRATQAVVFLINRSGQKRMQYLKILNLLYMADRASIQEKGFPITGDTLYAVEHGPVLSRIFSFIKCEPMEGSEIWAKYLRTDGYDLELAQPAPNDSLSRYDERVLSTIFETYKDMDGLELSELSRSFQEWKEAYRNGRCEIAVELVLKALGFDQDDQGAILASIEEERGYHAGIQDLKNELGGRSGKLLSA